MKKSSYNLFFKALANATRLEILELLQQEDKSVGEITKTLGLEQSRVSHSLNILKTWGLVASRKEGRKRIYSLDPEYGQPLIEALDKYMEKYQQKLETCGILKGKDTCRHINED